METANNTQTDGSDKTNRISLFGRIRRWYRGLPDKKRYLELITAFLTIPVLLSVLFSNVTNLRSQKTKETTPEPAQPAVITIVQPNQTPVPGESATPKTTPSPSATPGAQCKPEVGPISIVSPEEKDIVTGDPICLDISRTKKDYCSVVWSYRINGGAWSAYTGNSICMFGLNPGPKTLDLRIKSIVSDDEEVLTRRFTVNGNTPTPATSSGSTQ